MIGTYPKFRELPFLLKYDFVADDQRERGHATGRGTLPLDAHK